MRGVMMLALAKPTTGIVFATSAHHVRGLHSATTTNLVTTSRTTPTTLENKAFANKVMEKVLLTPTIRRSPRTLLDDMARFCGWGLGGVIILAVNLVDMVSDLVTYGPPHLEVRVRRGPHRDDRRNRSQRRPLGAHPRITT